MPEGTFEDYEGIIKPDIEITKERYWFPFSSKSELKGIEVNGPSHEGPNEGAIDFLLPDNTEVLAPIDGKIIAIEQRYDSGGETQASEHTLNYLVLETPQGERCLLAHLGKNSVSLPIGSEVKRGDNIAKTGSTGWTDTPHLHMQIVKPLEGESYVSKKIQFVGKHADYKPPRFSSLQGLLSAIVR